VTRRAAAACWKSMSFAVFAIHAPVIALRWRARRRSDAAPVWERAVSGPGRGGLRVVEGGHYSMNAVNRLHRFQGEHPEVQFLAPHIGGHGRYIANIPAGTLPHDAREITLSSADLTGLMDQLDDLLPPRTGAVLTQAHHNRAGDRTRVPGRAAEMPRLDDSRSAAGADVPPGP